MIVIEFGQPDLIFTGYHDWTAHERDIVFYMNI